MSKKKLITPIVMTVGIVLCSIARLFTISQTDMKLGSIKHGYEVICNALYYGVLVVSAVLAAVFAASPKKSGEDAAGIRLSGKSAAAVGFGLLAVGVGTAYDAVLMTKVGSAATFFMAAGFVFAALFIICAFVTLYKKEVAPGLGFAYSLGGIYFMLRGVFCFMSRMVVAAIPEYLIEELCAVFGGVFFVIMGQLFTGNEGRLTRKMLCGWGTGTAALTLSALLGTAAAKLFLGSEVSRWIVLTSVEADKYFQSVRGVDGYRLAFPSFSNIGLGILAVVTVIAVSAGGRSCAAPTGDIQLNSER